MVTGSKNYSRQISMPGDVVQFVRFIHAKPSNANCSNSMVENLGSIFNKVAASSPLGPINTIAPDAPQPQA
jgi:hypothetical protein